MTWIEVFKEVLRFLGLLILLLLILPAFAHYYHKYVEWLWKK